MSETIWFTSDTHFGHMKLAIGERGFTCVEEHDDELITRRNERAGPQDVVYHLGDVGLRPPRALKPILDQLDGRIRLIRGNHEKSAMHKLCRDRFEWIKDVYELKMPDGNRIWLSHYAHLIWPKAHYGAWHCYGHSHGSLAESETRRAMDVGVDAHGFYPIGYDTVVATLAARGFVAIDHHDEEYAA